MLFGQPRQSNRRYPDLPIRFLDRKLTQFSTNGKFKSGPRCDQSCLSLDVRPSPDESPGLFEYRHVSPTPCQEEGCKPSPVPRLPFSSAGVNAPIPRQNYPITLGSKSTQPIDVRSILRETISQRYRGMPTSID